MRVSKTLFTLIRKIVWITFSVNCLISSNIQYVNTQTVELRRPTRYGFGRSYYSAERSIVTPYNIPGHVSELESKMLLPKHSTQLAIGERLGSGLDLSTDKRNSLPNLARSVGQFGRHHSNQEQSKRPVLSNDKNTGRGSQSRKPQLDRFKSSSQTTGTTNQDVELMWDNTTQTRWW